MSSVVDNLVTHPNVMNGAVLYWPEPGMQYVEGYALDEFCAGRWARGTPYKTFYYAVVFASSRTARGYPIMLGHLRFLMGDCGK